MLKVDSCEGVPTDYEAITAENIRNYGEKVSEYGRVLLAELYSERTHFIFELLQNADDAGATWIEFRLAKDGLAVLHDGRPFTEADVRGICGLVAGTKAGDEEQIGKFGIGFKSVFAYTRSPEVHSCSEHFVIEQYVRPRAIESRSSSDETLFMLPFDHPEISSAQSYEQIRRRLERLEPETLLFLRNLRRISWRVPGNRSGSYERRPGERIGIECEVLETQRDGEKRLKWWLKYEEPMVEHPALGVEIAYALSFEGSPRISPLNSSPLFAFLPTEKETNLGFLINAPFLTTPARDNIKEHPINRSLIRQTATLVVNSLYALREASLIDVNVLKAMPHRPQLFQDTDFYPIFTEVRSALREEDVLPAIGGGTLRAKNAKLAREVAVRQLLDADSLRDLHPGSDVEWLTEDITIDRTPELHAYVRQEIGIEELDAPAFARKVTGSFLDKRSDEWMARLYTFLERREAMWRRGGPLRDKPIIRLEKGGHIAPFKADGTPSAYIPPHHETSLPIVKRSVVSLSGPRFLENIGYTKPDQVAEVLETILPKYRSAGPADLGENVADLTAMAAAIQSESRNVQLLSDRIRQTACILGRNAAGGGLAWKMPPSLYLPNPDLELYFEANEHAWFLSEGYPVNIWWSLQQLGVRQRVQVTHRKPNGYGHVILRDDYGDHSRGLGGFDPDATVDGLDLALRHPSVEKSAFIWNEILRPRTNLIAGLVESSSRQDYAGAADEEKPSRFGRQVRQLSWLPTEDGSFVPPSELALDDLPGAFVRDEILGQRLGMKASSIRALAEEAGIDYEAVRLLKQHEELFRPVIEQIRQRRLADSAEEDDFSFSDSLAERFATRLEGGELLDHVEPGAVPDVALRKERIRAEIESAQETEPDRVERFSLVTSHEWEKKNKSVRSFLENEYGGRCQICQQGFAKRNKRPHFEGLYLIPYTKARWVDRPGNVLCLCPTCAAKMLYGPLEAADIRDQILGQELDDPDRDFGLRLRVCGEDVVISFTQRHMLDLQQLVQTQ